MRVLLLAAVAISMAGCSHSAGGALPITAGVASSAGARALSGLRVSGNELVDGSNSVVHLRGVNRSGTEYACVQGWGIFDGLSNAASIEAMTNWHVNVVRVLLNEDCWLAINGIKPRYAGKNYRKAIVDYVNLLHRYGMYAELSLVYGAPGKYKATYQSAAPDEDHSPAMWSSMASVFKDDPNVILAPWGETTVDWACFMRKGCDDEAKFGPYDRFYRTAPMRQAVQDMRAAGYHGIVSLPCINFANACGKINGQEYDGSTWLKSRPPDPDRQTIAEAQVFGNDSCDSTPCFDSSMRPIARIVPMIFAETGEAYGGAGCGPAYISQFMTWADAHNVGYEAWTWDTWGGCGVLIKSYNGMPSSRWARWVKKHYARKS
jgi:endoglucanase